MISKILLPVILICLVASMSLQASFIWPDGKKAAVNLAYDDALNSQLDNAVPILNKYQLKASFYLTMNSPVVKNRTADWRELAKEGHELGNHTIYHACRGSLPGRDWVDKKNDLDHKSVAELVDEVLNANRLLQALDGETSRTFTVPCADHFASGKNYVNQIKSQFIAIKGQVGTIEKSIKNIDLNNINVIAPVNMSGEELIQHVKTAAKYGTMVNFTFHGIGADHLSISSKAHQQLVEYLAKNQDIYWVDTFKNISLYIKHQNTL